MLSHDPITIIAAKSSDDIVAARELFGEYLKEKSC